MTSAALADPVHDAELAEKAIEVQDLPRAMELFRAAALQSYAPAQIRYAELLDAAEEDELAVFWYRIAIEQGSAAGEMGLGGMYLKGEGVKKDEEKALSLIQHAAQSYLPAAELLEKYYRDQAKFWEGKASSLKAKATAEKTTDKPSK